MAFGCVGSLESCAYGVVGSVPRRDRRHPGYNCVISDRFDSATINSCLECVVRARPCQGQQITQRTCVIETYIVNLTPSFLAQRSFFLTNGLRHCARHSDRTGRMLARAADKVVFPISQYLGARHSDGPLVRSLASIALRRGSGSYFDVFACADESICDRLLELSAQ
jgi:hypothetical protein